MKFAAHYARTAAKARQTRDQLAELVADGMTIKDARIHLGIAQSAATKHWRRIRDDLGWQAQ